MKNNNLRFLAVQVLQAVFVEGHSLSEALHPVRESLKPTDAAWLQALCYGVARDYGMLDALLNKLMPKPLKTKDADIQLLLLVGLYQLRSMQVAQHAAVNETVAAVKHFKKTWAVGVVNGVLRNFIRQMPVLEAQIPALAKYSHPEWLIKQLQQDWPEQWLSILDANQQHPPMTLRVNIRKTSCADYLASLQKAGIEAECVVGLPAAIILKQAVDVTLLPYFQDGWVSVQDASAQLAAGFLSCVSDMKVLDACAAPGGKAAHLLESIDNLDLLALDHDALRLLKVTETLKRLQLKASVKCADVAEINTWWDGQLFDRILLDAPCSATGVIRRHPDIKWLREPEDIANLAVQQLKLLTALWSLLKSGGKLLYATCSVLKAENHRVIQAFLEKQKDAVLELITLSSGFSVAPSDMGVQCLPGLGDGFFYALLQKP